MLNTISASEVWCPFIVCGNDDYVLFTPMVYIGKQINSAQFCQTLKTSTHVPSKMYDKEKAQINEVQQIVS